MQFEGRRRSSQIPNLTPLIDIVFLLLVFFMLTSHFVRDEAIDLDLPVAESGEALEEDNRIEVVIDATGNILLHEHFVELSSLEETLGEELEKSSEKVVRIRGDRSAALGKAVTVMDAARKAGAQAVDIVTEHK